jgi:hypothetical protein
MNIISKGCQDVSTPFCFLLGVALDLEETQVSIDIQLFLMMIDNVIDW